MCTCSEVVLLCFQICFCVRHRINVYFWYRLGFDTRPLLKRSVVAAVLYFVIKLSGSWGCSCKINFQSMNMAFCMAWICRLTELHAVVDVGHQFKAWDCLGVLNFLLVVFQQGLSLGYLLKNIEPQLNYLWGVDYVWICWNTFLLKYSISWSFSVLFLWTDDLYSEKQCYKMSTKSLFILCVLQILCSFLFLTLLGLWI